jgi:hypothetical protein
MQGVINISDVGPIGPQGPQGPAGEVVDYIHPFLFIGI